MCLIIQDQAVDHVGSVSRIVTDTICGRGIQIPSGPDGSRLHKRAALSPLDDALMLLCRQTGKKTYEILHGIGGNELALP